MSGVNCGQDIACHAWAHCSVVINVAIMFTTGGMSEHVQAGTMGNEALHSFLDTQSFCASSSFHCATARQHANSMGACGSTPLPCQRASLACMLLDTRPMHKQLSSWQVLHPGPTIAKKCSTAPEQGARAIRQATPKVMQTCCLWVKGIL